MRTLLIMLALMLALGVGCGDTTPATPDLTDYTAETSYNVDSEFGPATPPMRDLATDLTVEQAREWLGVWFAEFYAERFANSLYDYDWMVCWLYHDAKFTGMTGICWGSKNYFNGPAFNDFFILMLIDMVEYKYGVVAEYPVDIPDC